ncbi:ribbon-helix-helix domain-containing protein [Haloarcula nitratireducens]|uniref:Ribbon-helix-helix protein, CopG family n=1 Tax=Haloarcula nitratireducens TaxID=2487749 RepID=A0AAW4PHI2_9EURY|nr:ribbon-helix-helix domain-containing protein [Halomicroarcula nitratireducens]MBX0297936.1 ribbon-helix-helix protein, CopG family [Halomicroarcula nitratireducens]
MEPTEISNRQDSRQEDAATTSCAVCGTTNELKIYPIEQTATESGQQGPTQITLCNSHALLAKAYDLNADTTDGDSVGHQLSHQETQKITARVPKPLLEALDEVAGNRGLTRSELIRDFFEQSIRAAEAEAELDDFLYRLADLRAQNNQLIQALNDQHAGTEPDHTELTVDEHSADIEFLKQRIERLESLLEQTIEKL